MIKFKDILKEHSLGKLPSESLLKMKWNPITESRPVFPGEEVEDMNEESYPMDKSFAKDFEKSCKAFENHIMNEIKEAIFSTTETKIMMQMVKNLRLVKGYPALMAKMVGQE